MAFLVRKLSRAKWPENDCKIENLDGDAIGDLRTTNNTLSLWRIDSEDELSSAALALAASSKSSSIETIGIVWISESSIQNIKIDIYDHPGDTIVTDLINMHRDLCGITYKSLGEISEIIIKEVLQEKHYKRFQRREVKAALAKAYNEKRICEEKCPVTLLEEIKKAANTIPTNG